MPTPTALFELVKSEIVVMQLQLALLESVLCVVVATQSAAAHKFQILCPWDLGCDAGDGAPLCPLPHDHENFVLLRPRSTAIAQSLEPVQSSLQHHLAPLL